MEKIALRDIGMAYAYVTERYIFNKKNYPELEYLPPKFHSKFALRHVMDHIEKWIPIYMKNFPKHTDAFKQAFVSPSFFASPAELFRESTVKILLNLLRMSDLVGITIEELRNVEVTFLEKKRKRELDLSRKIDLPALISIIREQRAKTCETADHGAPLRLEDLKTLLLCSWEDIFYFFDEKDLALIIVWNMIPEYMKST